MQNQLPKGKEHEKTLGLFDLSILGIGAIIGTGILVLTGIVAAEDSGPAIVFSFLIAALASGLIGLCYSELTTSLPNSGSAFYYAWVSIGKFMALLLPLQWPMGGPDTRNHSLKFLELIYHINYWSLLQLVVM